MAKKAIAVIGGGPGGYVAAIRAAQLGADVTLVEKARMGGTCLNVGCIPTKALLHSAHVFHEAGSSAAIGVEAAPRLDWEKVQLRRKSVVERLVSGVEGLMRANRIRVAAGEASFLDAHRLKILGAEGEQALSFDACIIAAGSAPAMPPIPGLLEAGCIDSAQALELDRVPASLLVLGGGVIGVELATAYHRFGAKVTIVEMADHILPNMEQSLTARLERELRSSGVEVMTKSRVIRAAVQDGVPACLVEHGGREEWRKAEKLLVCTGRKAVFAGLHLEKAGVRFGRAIEADSHMRTNIPHIYAVGDCNGQLMLAHAASEQGMIAAENCMGADVTFDASLCPSGVYSSPELAGVGLTEKQAREQGIACRTAAFPAAANGRSLILQQESGVVKVVVGEQYGELLGVHICGAQATELIAEAALALKLEATAEELAGTIHPHPTLSECLREAALAAMDRAVHISGRKR